jgi:hypothetical protein
LTTTGTWTNAATGTSSTSIALSGLASSSTYDYRVRTNCSGSSSSYSSAQFTTSSPATCNAPAGLAASSITTSSATVSWGAVSGALSYDADYKLTSTGTWTNAATGTTSTSVALSGLASSSTYDYRVRTNCSSGSSSYTSAQFTTATASTCATAFEPNETQAAAATISSGVANSAAISTTADIDYFKITTAATSNIVYNLAGPSGVDYDLYIYNSAGTQIGSSTGSTATESVSLTGQTAGTYYVKVLGYNGANSATCYTITATATAVTGCQSSYDNTTNGTTSGAATIPFNTNITGLISPASDVDHYKFVITTGGTITITLGTLPGDYDVKLLNSAGTQVGISQNGGTTSETINYTAAAGTYYAQVYGYNGANSATSCYTLKAQLGTASRGEENIMITKLKPTVNAYPNPVQNIVNVDINGVSGTTEIRVYDINGRQVMSQITGSKKAQLDMSALTGGLYMLKVMSGEQVVSSVKIVKE